MLAAVAFHIAFATVAALSCAAAGLTATKVTEVTRTWDSARETSGITWAGGDTYYAVDDRDNRLYKLAIELDSAGSIVTSKVVSSVIVFGAHDMEGCAFDPVSSNVWVSDEYNATIREIDPATGKALRSVSLPAVQKKFYYNYSLESLAISSDGLTMWTSNEESLPCDGTNSTKTAGSTVRLTRFTRRSGDDNWYPSGQWAYLTDPVGSNPFVWNGKTMTRSGVADVAVLPDGTLLVLERKLRHEGLLADDFYARIYAVDLACATDVSSLESLGGAQYTLAKKSLVYSTGRMTMVNYEGMCIGPSLGDSSHKDVSLVVVSDAGASAMPKLMSLKLSAASVEN